MYGVSNPTFESDLRASSSPEQKLRGNMLLTQKSMNSTRIEQGRWDHIATEVRGSVAGMKDQVSTSLRKLAEKQRDFDEAIALANDCS